MCVIWRGVVDLQRLDGTGYAEFDEDRAKVMYFQIYRTIIVLKNIKNMPELLYIDCPLSMAKTQFTKLSFQTIG